MSDKESVIESIRSRYTDIINQNTNVSESIARSIQMADLGDQTSEMVTEAMTEIQDEVTRKTFVDRCTEMLPAVIGDRIQSQIKKAERINLKHKNIAEVATKHFDLLSDKRDMVKDNLTALYDIHEKLDQSIVHLKDLGYDLADAIIELEDDKSANAKKQMIVAKELSVQIASQIATQQDLINQLDMVDFTASIVLDTINQTLPDIKANFIDQISISTALENLKNFKESVDKTRRMTISLQEDTFQNTSNIMTAIADQGVGLSEDDIKRMEKLADAKHRLNQNISVKLIENTSKLDNHLSRLQKINERNIGSFDQISIEDLSGGTAFQRKREENKQKDEDSPSDEAIEGTII